MEAISVMLVDADADVLEALEAVLVKHLRAEDAAGIVFDRFSTPEEALAAAVERPYALALADFRLPGMDGVEMLSRLHYLQPDVASIVLCGARDFDFVLRAVNPDEISRVVLKPWLEAELIAAMRQALEHRRLLSENRDLLEALETQRSLLIERGNSGREPLSINFGHLPYALAEVGVYSFEPDAGVTLMACTLAAGEGELDAAQSALQSIPSLPTQSSF
jgi:two-component system probable response regulator PhcQ